MSKGRYFDCGDALDRVQPVLSVVGKEARIAGSLRRGKPAVRDVDVVLPSPMNDLLMARLKKVADVVQAGGRKVRLLVPVPGVKFKKDEPQGLQVDIVLCEPEEFGACLLYLTGPSDYNVAMRAYAKGLGLKLNEKGLWKPTHLMVVYKDGRKKEYTVAAWEGLAKSTRKKAKKVQPSQWERIAGATEKEIYEALGLPYTSPAGRDELKTFAKQVLWSMTVPSSKKGQDPYVVSLQGDGIWHCTCPGWRWCKKRPKTCRHIRDVAKPAYEKEQQAA